LESTIVSATSNNSAGSTSRRQKTTVRATLERLILQVAYLQMKTYLAAIFRLEK
jgi:hypothetical protein